ncbi:MAG TPA: hypothetical protein PKD69_02095 [Elusimicrobiota bacterium]|jgi:hypothetical protein|nr:hypothetical protein [Elusimicrobiota bacterium]
MAANEIHKGDIGTVFTVTVKEGSVVVDLSSSTAKQIKFRKRSGSILTKTASFVTDGTDGKIKYTTIAGDLDESGPWSIQAVLTFGTNVWSTDIKPFTVHHNVADL